MTRARAVGFWIALFAGLLVSRLCHSNVLWADEDYHLAAAIQTLHGKAPYRDFWYDKPPLNLAFYLLDGARAGVALRILDAAFLLLCCVLAYRFAARVWSRREGYFAAGSLAFFLIFYLPNATIPLEPDTLMIAPHLGAVYLAWRRKPLAAGFVAGLAFLLNAKGAFVAAACALFGGIPLLVAGFVLPNLAALGWLAAIHALPDYAAQVWKWGFLYLGSAPPGEGVMQALLNWTGFHAVLVIGAIAYWRLAKTGETGLTARLWGWLALSLLACVAGWRAEPRYWNQLLPPLIILAAPGLASLLDRTKLLEAGYGRRAAAAGIAVAAIVPVIRFGPHYAELAADDLAGRAHSWKDTAMDRENREAARMILAAARPGDTIFIWGYRPGVVALTRLPVAGRLWDSQPVTGVPADRHLSVSRPLDAAWARENRRELARTRPVFLVDGLSRYNPRLDIHLYSDLAPWLAGYCEMGHAGLTTIYRRCSAGGS